MFQKKYRKEKSTINTNFYVFFQNTDLYIFAIEF